MQSPSAVIRAQRLAGLGVSFSADETETTYSQRLLPGSRPRSHRAKGCGSQEWLGALLLQAADPNPTPGCRDRRSGGLVPCRHYGGAGVSFYC